MTSSTAASTYAPLASPVLTGTPTAPTPIPSDNSLNIANTAYVQTNLSSYLTSSTAASTYAPLTSLSNYLTSSTAASTYAPLTSMSSYLTSSSAASTYAPLTSLSNYLTSSSAASTYATIANPTLTGTPKSTTPATSDNSTNIATTAYVQSCLTPIYTTVSYSTTPNFNFNNARQGFFKLTLTASTTITISFSNMAVGAVYQVLIIAPATGPTQINYPTTNIKKSFGSATFLSVSANTYNYNQVSTDGTTTFIVWSNLT